MTLLTHLLDTSVYSQPVKRFPLKTVVDKWKNLGDSAICTSILCEAELLQGLEKIESEELWKRYKLFLKDRLPVMPFDIHAAKIYAEIHREGAQDGIKRPVICSMIASIALSRNLVLATCSIKGFTGIKGLRVENWLE